MKENKSIKLMGKFETFSIRNNTAWVGPTFLARVTGLTRLSV